MTEVTKPSPKEKKRKCPICKERFIPKSSTQVCVKWECALEKAKQDRLKREKRAAKLENKIVREKLEKLKTLGEHLKDTERECNAYIRARDHGEPCISCGKYFPGKDQAGHYRSVGAAPQLRFNEDNIHSQCVRCNMHQSGSGIEYRINLIKKIGLERVESLENNNQPALYTIEDAKRLKKEFQEKRKALEKQNIGM